MKHWTAVGIATCHNWDHSNPQLECELSIRLLELEDTHNFCIVELLKCCLSEV